MHALLILFALLLPPGLYDRAGHMIYVGTEHSLPDTAVSQFYDPANQQTGDLPSVASLRQVRGIREARRQIGSLGVSVYYGDAKKRPAIILVHGADPETREMGFIIPYFVLNGINVISYDQRGTGASSGNWLMNGPSERAADVEAIYDALQSDAHVDSHRIGIWGFSNGGWTAPIVAVNRPLAFMILKSAAAESLSSNIDYEAMQEMKAAGMSAAQTQVAVNAWHDFEAALNGGSWDVVKSDYKVAKAEHWFDHSLLLDIPLPPSAAMQAGLRRYVTFDPTQTLQQVKTPTLALYGDHDTKVDAKDSAARMPSSFEIIIYKNGLHTLVIDGSKPYRYVKGYPHVMIDWLAKQGFRA